MSLLDVIQTVLKLTAPLIKKLIESKLIPTLKRNAYEKVDKKVDGLIEDLAQNATKILKEENETKKYAYIEGTKLGIETIRGIAEKLNKSADEIEKAING